MHFRRPWNGAMRLIAQCKHPSKDRSHSIDNRSAVPLLNACIKHSPHGYDTTGLCTWPQSKALRDVYDAHCQVGQPPPLRLCGAAPHSRKNRKSFNTGNGCWWKTSLLYQISQIHLGFHNFVAWLQCTCWSIMEFAGLAMSSVALASLFSTCIECFDYVDIARNY